MALHTAVFSLLLLGVFVWCHGSPLDSSCEDVHLACTNKPFHDSLQEDGFSFLSEETLNEHCSDMLEDIKCKAKYLSICDPIGYEAFALATDGIKDVLHELCNETTLLRKEFRKHSPCISGMRDIYEDCMLNTVDVANVMDSDFDGDDVVSNEATIQRMCRFYEPFKTCVTRDTRTYCGDSAAQLLEQIIVRAAATAVNAKCRLNSTSG